MDGVQRVGSAALTGTIIASSNTGRIGSGEDVIWDGVVDEVRTYNRALSADEIKRLYKIGSTFVFNATRKDTLTSGLVGHWSFDGQDITGVTAYDRSGQGNNGTLTNGPTRAAGKIGQALSFDGVNDFVDAGTNLDQNGEMTISAWFKTRAVTGNRQALVCNGSGASTFDYCLQINVTAGKLTGSWDNTFVATGNTALSADTWYHAAFVRTGSSGSWTLKLYLNGVQDASDTTAIDPNATDLDTEIGIARVGNFPFNGSLDDVRIYNRALSPDEIKRLYNMGGTLKTNVTRKDVLTDGLVGHWSFDGQDVAGVTAYDRSGQGNNGTLTNGPARAAGKIGQALSFDGVNDFVNVGTNLDQNGEMTIVAWFNSRDVTGGIREIVANGISAGNYDYYLDINRTTAGRLSGGWLNVGVASGNTDLTANTWYHAAFVRTGSSGNWNLKLYLNGVQDASANTAVDPNSTNNTTAIGRLGGQASFEFDGFIDDVRIYNRALSADDIKRLYNMGR